MGGFPKYALTSIIMPKTTSVDFIDGLYDGLNKAAKKYKISIIGGNLSSGDKISITLTIVGFVEKKNLCLRSNAKVNDLILVTGNLGSSRAGLELFRSNKSGSSINYYLNPASKLNIARQLIKYGINAMEDVSDGLASEIINICSESNVGAVIYKEKIPLKSSTIIDAKKIKKDPYDYALYGGEDFEMVFTISQKSKRFLGHKKLQSNFFVNNNKFKKLNMVNKKIKFSVVGEILPKKQGIYLLDKGKKKKLKYGYEHFKK